MSIFSPNFAIGSIRIGTIEGASSLNMGNNVQSGFKSHQKVNQGLGNISGDGNQIEGLKSLLHDSTILDMLINEDAPENLPGWLQEYIQEKIKEQNNNDSYLKS